jgi:bidirectional [NiFe] hydrogenase diaphorase subunit
MAGARGITMRSERETAFTLNGAPVTARPGETVLSVARRHGTDIPALCHHPAMADYGACRLCVVEVKWNNRSKLVTSCLYTPYENDQIETDSPRVRATRRVLLEMLWARCPDVDAVRDLAREYGVERPRFETPTSTALDKRCILCGLCVRVCGEVIGQHAIGYAHRGVERDVTAPFAGQAEACIGCGACVAVCPTGALHMDASDGEVVMREFNTRLPMARCKACGRPFAPVRQVAKAQSRLPVGSDAAERCPACKRAELCAKVGANVELERPRNG